MTFGGKAENLLQLRSHFQVPEFFVVAPNESLEHVLDQFDRLGAAKVAVRSSAVNEDSKDAAWAGQLETVLNVERDGLVAAVKQCRDSANSERAVAYAAAHHMASGEVAVIVQRMVAARCSGVAFSRHPVTGVDTVVVEAVFGLGESLVSGQVTPDTYLENSQSYLTGDTPILNRDEQQAVTTLARQVAELLSYPVDIEWAYEGNELYLLQARPITTL